MPENKTRLDPWTFGELHPSGMSHVTQPRAQPAGLAHPPRPARATRQASLPTAPYLSGGTCWLQAIVGLAVADRRHPALTGPSMSIGAARTSPLAA